MNYKKLNIIVGWITFIVAAITFLMTMEATASFWDCGEFITIAYKLEVGHPPGAPFFMFLGNFFTQFGKPAVMMNILSALASAFTILFLFWSVTHLTKRLIAKNGEPSLGETIAILGSGLIGGLAYTFSDTFWFSAVEAEVYATSSLFTAMVFWAILKWENVADEPYSNRWLILICYLAGLSIGVHLLNLLAIPAIAMVYYYRKFKVSNKGIAVALIVSGILLGLILYGIIPGAVTVATWFELMFVNGFGLPINSGVFFYFAVLIAGIIWLIHYTNKKQKVLWNTVILGVTVILIGYSSYMVIPIRSNAKLPMDQNNPDDAFSMLSFLNREQYGHRPLITGQYYNSPLDTKKPYVKDKVQRVTRNGKYVISDIREKPNYDERFTTFFPRMWSKNQEDHIEAYKEWGKIKGTAIKYNSNGETKTIIKPTFGENLRFFFTYQVNFMYLRYFWWNFAGRQNDIQGHGKGTSGELINGNWISGIKFIDEARLGNQDNLPPKFANNRGRNKYYFLPFLLGVFGIVFQYRNGEKGKRDLWVVTLLFISTGLAIVVYLNQYPFQPRERDYAFAGSFYAYALWIGMGVAGLYQFLKKIIPSTASASLVTVLALGVPILMAAQNWDDHDRSGRTSAPDFGQNYLACVEPGGVIFTNGDNDTYPLWYCQEVEGIGIDKRVCNLSYFQTDWYINQMQRKAYDSDPLPISFTFDQYVQGTRDVIYIMENPNLKGKEIELGRALEFIKDDSPGTKLAHAGNAAYLPVRDFYIKVDKQAVIDNGVVPADQYDQIVDTMRIRISGSYITKDQLMILDMLYNNNWKRPIYYAVSVGSDKYMSLDKYFRLEGLTYRIVPILAKKASGYSRGGIDVDIMYDNMMNKFKWGNLADPKVYVDENNSRMCTNMRNNFQRLAEELYNAGKKDSCIQVLDRCMEVIPPEKVPYDYFTVAIAKTYMTAGEKEKAIALAHGMLEDFKAELDYYFSFDQEHMVSLQDELRNPLYFLNEIMNMAKLAGEKELEMEVKEVFDNYYKQLNLL